MFPSTQILWRHSHGSLNLTEASPPQSFTEPLSVPEVKIHLNLPDTTSDQDGLLLTFISAAREIAETMQGRDLVAKQYDLSYDSWPGYMIELRAPLVSVDLVRYRDSNGDYTTLAVETDYVVDASKQPALLLPPYGKTWPSLAPYPSSAVLVRFTSGLTRESAFWSDSGQRVKLGMLLLISGWFNNRLPFITERGVTTGEFPYAVTWCLSSGALVRVR